jgi:hypothetical protein
MESPDRAYRAESTSTVMKHMATSARTEREARLLSVPGVKPVLRTFLNALYSFVPVMRFLFSETGSQYQLGTFGKIGLLWKSLICSLRIKGATSWNEHFVLLEAVLRIPPSIKGDLLEIGCYKGRSTASLSRVCKLTKRRLIVCDTFAGLPEPGADQHVFNLRHSEMIEYHAGQYCGTLAEVQNNVRRFGCIEVCEFLVGRAESVLPSRSDQYVMIFEDVDLPAAVEQILMYTWSRLQPGCKFFTEEAQDFPIAQLFYDRIWWNANLQTEPPGLVGAGIGLPLGPDGSGLGFAVRR